MLLNVYHDKKRMISMHSAIITYQFDSAETASIIYGSLLPELSKKIPHTTTKVTQSKNNITLAISGSTTPVLRAAINSYSRWIQTALNIEKIPSK
jgi:tRNA threonylcarbamoyladenosine modification (KEOPS) complex  Pcc1 subunit